MKKWTGPRCSGSWLKPDKPTVLIMAGSFGAFQYPQDLQQHYQGEPGFSDYRDYRQE